MNKALFVIDVQNYFTDSVATALPRNIARYVQTHRKDYQTIIFTRFVNTPHSSVYRFLKWKKSMVSPDIDIALELQSLLKYGVLVSKDVYSALKVPRVAKLLKEKRIEPIYLCGVDTDCCVLATAYDAFDQGYQVCLLENLCLSRPGKKLHEAAKAMFKRNVGPLLGGII